MMVYNFAKRWWRSKSIWFANGQMAAGAILVMVEARFDLISPYLGEWSGAVLMALGIINLVLRLNTSTAIVTKQRGAE